MQGEYYTAEEAMKKLSKPRSTFFKEVDIGLIPFELEPGRQRGRRFPKQAIDTLAERQYTKHRQKGPIHLIFSSSTPADLWTEVQIGVDLYGEDDIVPFGKLLDWRDINDELFMNAKDQGQVVAYSSLMPLEESIIHPLLEDKIRERSIPLKSIRQWTDPHVSVYISSVTVKPTGNRQKDRSVGRFIIKNTIKWALTLNQQYDIKNWYGIGATPEGQSLFETLGFEEIISLYDGQRKGYRVDDIRTPTRLIDLALKEIERGRG